MGSQTYNPVSFSLPGDILLNYLDAHSLSQRELSLRTGITTKTISEICNGKAPISPTTSLALEKVLGRPAHFWINLQSKYDEVKARTKEREQSESWLDWAKEFPLSEMRSRGWIQSGKKWDKPLAIQVLQFLGVSSPSSWDSVWNSSNVAYRQTRKFQTSELAIAVWVRAIELAADELEIAEYSEKTLLNSIDDIRASTRLPIDQGLSKVQSILANCGVGFVYIPALQKTGISGCTRWISKNKVIVAISLRYKTDDQIWFTLFHELGHVLLHRKEQSFIVDNADDNLSDDVVDPEMQKLEDEANRYAVDTLIPPEHLKKFLSFNIFTNESIYSFAEALDIAPGILVGRLQKERVLKHHQGNKLKQRVNWSFI